MKTLIASLVLAALAGPAASAQSKVLSVPQRTQEHSEWCWAGSSQMVLGFFGVNPTQCAEANYSLGINYACGNTNFNWNSNANSPNSTNAVSSILNAWGVNASVFNGYFYSSTVQTHINNSKPFIILWQWTGGGGHFVVVKGYSGSYLYINDPWPGNGSYTRTYSSTVSASDRYWYNTCYTY